MKRKIISIVLAAVLVLSMAVLAGCGKQDGGEKKVFNVGICQADAHVALDAATEGFKKALTDKLGEDAVVFDFQNAAGETAQCSTIVNNFVAKNVDLIMANATPALQAAYGATKDIPILGTSVTEYGVALGIENFSGTVGGNVSGTSDLAPLKDQGEMILELFPNAKNVGLLYCSAEPNSEYQVKVMEDFLAEKGVKTARYSFSDSNDVAAVTEKAASESDVIYIPTDNKAASCTGTIKSIVVNKKVPVIAGEQGICSGCGVATLSIDYYDLGYKTGEMAAQILSGEKNISEMEIAYAPAEKKYNKEICETLGIQIKDGYTAIEA